MLSQTQITFKYAFKQMVLLLESCMYELEFCTPNQNQRENIKMNPRVLGYVLVNSNHIIKSISNQIICIKIYLYLNALRQIDTNFRSQL